MSAQDWVLIITAIAGAAVAIIREIRQSRRGSQARHAFTQERLDTIEGAATGAAVEAGTANARIAELERLLAEERARQEVR